MRATHWWIYTVLIGLLPLLVRFVMYVSLRSATLGFVINESDLVSFGLVLGVANLKEIDHRSDADPLWRMKYLGHSVVSVVVFAAALVLANLAALNPELLDLRNIKLSLIVFCGYAVSLSYGIHVREVPLAATVEGKLKPGGQR